MKGKKQKVASTVVVSSPEASILLPNGNVKTIKKDVVIGRADFEGVVSDEIISKISAAHLHIWGSNGEYFIEDGYNGKSSTNGTLLNDKQIKGIGPQKLADGDVVKILNKVNIVVNIPTESASEPSKTMVVEGLESAKTRILIPTLTLFWDDRKHIWKVTDEIVFGKNDLVGLLIDNRIDQISSKHFHIFKEGNKFYIEDGYKGKPSTNGTVFRGEDIKGRGKQPVSEKDEIVLAGSIKLEVKKIEMEVSE